MKLSFAFSLFALLCTTSTSASPLPDANAHTALTPMALRDADYNFEHILTPRNVSYHEHKRQDAERAAAEKRDKRAVGLSEALVAADTALDIIDGVKSILDEIDAASQKDKEARDSLVKATLGLAQKKYPESNIAIWRAGNGDFEVKWAGEILRDEVSLPRLDLNFAETIYRYVIFTGDGELARPGSDGGWLNWGFGGKFDELDKEGDGFGSPRRITFHAW